MHDLGGLNPLTLVIPGLPEGLKIKAGDLREDEAKCLEELVAGANLISLTDTPNDSAEIDDFVAHLERCDQNMLGSTSATGTPAVSPTPEPTPTAERAACISLRGV